MKVIRWFFSRALYWYAAVAGIVFMLAVGGFIYFSDLMGRELLLTSKGFEYLFSVLSPALKVGAGFGLIVSLLLAHHRSKQAETQINQAIADSKSARHNSRVREFVEYMASSEVQKSNFNYYRLANDAYPAGANEISESFRSGWSQISQLFTNSRSCIIRAFEHLDMEKVHAKNVNDALIDFTIINAFIAGKYINGGRVEHVVSKQYDNILSALRAIEYALYFESNSGLSVSSISQEEFYEMLKVAGDVNQDYHGDQLYLRLHELCGSEDVVDLYGKDLLDPHEIQPLVDKMELLFRS